MKRPTCLMIIILGLIALPAIPNADLEIGSIAGTGEGLFESGAALGDVSLEGVELAIGVFIDPDGAAAGVFHAVLAGRSPLGDSQITVEGDVGAGSFGMLGEVSFSGVATVELSDGTPPLPGIPFSVTITTGGSVVLALDSTALPPAAIGGITVN